MRVLCTQFYPDGLIVPVDQTRLMDYRSLNYWWGQFQHPQAPNNFFFAMQYDQTTGVWNRVFQWNPDALHHGSGNIGNETYQGQDPFHQGPDQCDTWTPEARPTIEVWVA